MATETEHGELESFVPGEPGLAVEETADGLAPAPAKAAKEPKGEEPKLSGKETKALQDRIKELEGENRFWADKAKGNTTAPEPKKAEAPDELEALLAGGDIDGDTAAGLLDELGEKGIAALSRRGIVTKGQLKQIVGALEQRMEKRATQLADGAVAGARGQMTAEAKLLKEFPDLSDGNTPLAKKTADMFAEMVAEDPALKGNYTALGMAARAAKAQLGGAAGSVMERTERIAAQGPARGSRSSGVDSFEDADIELDENARQLISIGAKYGLTDDTYRANARRRN